MILPKYSSIYYLEKNIYVFFQFCNQVVYPAKVFLVRCLFIIIFTDSCPNSRHMVHCIGNFAGITGHLMSGQHVFPTHMDDWVAIPLNFQSPDLQNYSKQNFINCFGIFLPTYKMTKIKSKYYYLLMFQFYHCAYFFQLIKHQKMDRFFSIHAYEFFGQKICQL